jgi:hypothetical protein
MINPDPELARMLAQPRFMPEPVFTRAQYLAQVTCGMFGNFLRVTNQPAEIFKQIQEMYRDDQGLCVKAGMFIAWGFDLGQPGVPVSKGREGFVHKAKPPTIKVTGGSSAEILEQVFHRDVVRIQVEPDAFAPKPPPGAQIVQLKDIGWYAARLVMPTIKTPPASAPVPAPSPGGPPVLPLNPELKHQLDHPRVVNLLGTACSNDNYLDAFALHQFQLFLQHTGKAATGRIVKTSGNDPRLVALVADSIGFWVMDLDRPFGVGRSGLEEFWMRVAEPVRRPPAHLARIAMEHHIIVREIVELRFDNGLPQGGILQRGETRRLGWYAATLVAPKR